MSLKLILALACAAALLAAVAYGRHLHVENADLKTALRRSAQALLIASGEIKTRDAKLQSNAAHEGQDANQTASFWKGQCHAAFDAGYASRRCGDPGQSAGVRGDLRTLWEAGAFRAQPAAGGVSGQPRR